MDLRYTPEQEELIRAAERFLARASPVPAVRALVADARGFDPGVWREMAALGWLTLELPGERGGLSFLEVTLLAEAMGRMLLSSPFVCTAAMAVPLVQALAGVDEGTRWLTRLGEGELVATVALVEEGWVDPFGEPRLAVAARGAPRLTGQKHFVPFAAHADLVLVVAANAQVVAVEPPADGFACARRVTLGGDPLYDVTFEETPGVSLGRAEPALLRRVLDRGAVASLAYGMGAAAGALGLTVEYARTRQQFGRPIGSFQAVAHRCADMRSDLDAARYLVYQAAWALAEGRDAALEVGAALAYGLDALRRLALNAHQVHGAIGFSTEHDLHLYTRRLKAIELSWGAAAAYRERVAVAMGL